MKPRVRHTALLLLLAALLGGCSKSNPTAPPIPANVTTDPARATSGSIGPDGGVLTATSSNGIRYTLNVPAGALALPVDISMTPVSDLKTVPGASRFAGAVVLHPNGLHFAHAATLTIEPVASVGAGQFPIGFFASPDGDTLALDLAQSQSGKIVLPVEHFSIPGAVFGTTADLSTLPAPPPGVSNESFGDRFLRAQAAGELTIATSLLHDWFAQVVAPELSGAASDAELLIAVSDYDHWRSAIDFLVLVPLGAAHANPPEFASEFTAAGTDAAPRLAAAVEGNITTCRQAQSFDALANVLFWQQQAGSFDVADAAHALDLPTVLADIKAHAVHLELVHSDLPLLIPTGFPESLDLTFAAVFVGSSEPHAVPSSVHLAASNATVQHPDGFTDAAGNYTTVITAAGGDVVVNYTADLILPGRTTPTPIEGAGTITGSSFSVCGEYKGSGNVAEHLVDGTDEFEPGVAGVVDMTVREFGNTVSGSATILVDGSLNFVRAHFSATVSAGGVMSNVTVSTFTNIGDCRNSVLNGTASLSGGTLTIDASAGGNGKDCGTKSLASESVHWTLARIGEDGCTDTAPRQ